MDLFNFNRSFNRYFNRIRNRYLTHFFVLLIAFVINTLIILALPYLKYSTENSSFVNYDSNEIEGVEVNLARPPERKKKLLTTPRPKIAGLESTPSLNRFELDLGVNPNLSSPQISLSGKKINQQDIIYSQGEVDVNPIRISGQLPIVPESFVTLKNNGIEGLVELKLVINEKGTIQSIKDNFEKPTGFGLAEEAIKAVRTWKFRPAEINTIPVRVEILLPILF